MQLLDLDGLVVVTSPQQLAFEIVRKAINMSKTMNVKILGLVENMSYAVCPHCNERIDLFGESEGGLLAKKAEVPFLGNIPIDPKISTLSDSGGIEQYQSEEIDKIVDNVIKNVD
jgi:Mrp family chromosome partitioning ATPase